MKPFARNWSSQYRNQYINAFEKRKKYVLWVLLGVKIVCLCYLVLKSWNIEALYTNKKVISKFSKIRLQWVQTEDESDKDPHLMYIKW